MKSLNNSTVANSAFTLIEMLVVVGLFLSLVTISIVASVSHIQKTSLTNDRDLLLSLLWHARSRALANVEESPHGVHVTSDSFISFLGASYDASAIDMSTTPHSPNLYVSGNTTIIFEPLTGAITSGETITTLRRGTETILLTVNAHGRIDW